MSTYNEFDALDPREQSKLDDLLTRLDITLDEVKQLNMPPLFLFGCTDETILESVEKIRQTNKVTKEKPKTKKSKKVEKVVEEKEIVDVSKDIKQPKPETAFDNKRIDFSKVDLNNLNLLTSMSAFEAQTIYKNQRKALFNVPIFEITLPISGYNAKMRGLRIDEVDFIKNSFYKNDNSLRQAVEDLVFNCIVETGIPNFTKEKFLQYTCNDDFECLLYGIVRNTYGILNEFRFTCPHCAKTFEQNVVTSSLVQSKAEVVGPIVMNIIDTNDPEKTAKESVLNTYKNRFMFKTSGIIVDLKFNNIKRDKAFVEKFETEFEKNQGNTSRLFVMGYVDKMYIPIVENNNISYYPIDSVLEIYSKLNDVEIDDMKECVDTIQKMIESYTISFKTPVIQCQQCSKEIPEIPLNIYENFFARIIGN